MVFYPFYLSVLLNYQLVFLYHSKIKILYHLVLLPLYPQTKKERQPCNTGTLIMLRVLFLVGLVRAQGGVGWVEHPEDPGASYPSVWSSCAIKLFCSWGFRLACFDLCTFWSFARKPTCIMSTSDTLHQRLHNARCLGGHIHAKTAGPREGGVTDLGHFGRYFGQNKEIVSVFNRSAVYFNVGVGLTFLGRCCSTCQEIYFQLFV